MAVQTSYPGLYIQELPSSSHSIAAAPTNIAVFIGLTHPLKTDPANWGKPVQLFGMADYQRGFGGFVRSSAFAAGGDATAFTRTDHTTGLADPTTSFGDMTQALSQFFLNGGTQAYVVGVKTAVTAGEATIEGLKFTATELTATDSPMNVTVRPINPAAAAMDIVADIIITYGPSTGPGTITETFRQVSMKAADPNYALTKLATSQLVSVALSVTPAIAFPTTTKTATLSDAGLPAGGVFDAAALAKVMDQDTGLDKLPLFNLMVIPGVVNTLVLSTALAFCERKRAFLIMDPPITVSADGTGDDFKDRVQDYIGGTALDLPAPPTGSNAALYFPYLTSPDPLTGGPLNALTGKVNEIPPAPTVAGLFAATDLARGVWKAPAGFQTTTLNTTGVVERGQMTEMRQGTLNPIGVNCLRDFPNVGTAVFGARTLVTLTEEQWRYVPVRRTALFLEQSLLGSLGWVVFEPNDEPLWSAIRMSINAFMLGLFRQGAFQGTKPSEAFSVQCDSQTTTQADIDNGIVNIVVAFAPLKPAEFVIISIAQLAGQAQTP